MRPLNESKEFLKRFDSFRGSTLHKFTVNSPIQLVAHFSVQDSSRDFDWIDIFLEFNEVSSAELINESITLDDGIILHVKNSEVKFCIGDNCENSKVYIFSKSLKYEEASCSL